MNITLRQLRAFIAVARTSSFTLAAESLFVTQSALSGLIKEMEQSLGVRLFDRSTRRIQLSDIGREIFPLIDKTLLDLDGVLHEVANLKALKKGLVRVAAPQLMCSTLLPEVIAAYREQHPEIEIRLVDCAVESVVSRVFSGEVDFGIGPERDPNSEIRSDELFTLPFHAVFPPRHALAAKKEIRWAELIDYPLITLEGQFTERLSMDLHEGKREFDLAPQATVTFMSTALSMVSAGLGVTICIPYAASLVRLYGLEMRPLLAPVVSRRFYVFTRTGRSLTPAAESLRAFVLGFIARHPDLQGR
ncbi:LysR family transcriptional regulator [Aromatoleum toluclasticum]|uniref:LysR family transcriptional regulator n=1 Tax=Aromatoleum toluclasticum TaxID=92003 RepID=UPI001D1899D8|nr:LysR family transcriptional regulator [Aromatoleum toluclasticum]MCC4117665.1 LysR family transcriptional regulator [Aromatoleum toluclasticum]